MLFLSVSTASVAAVMEDDFPNTIGVAVVMEDSSKPAQSAVFGRSVKEDSAVLKLRNGLISGAATRAAKELVLHPVETIK